MKSLLKRKFYDVKLAFIDIESTGLSVDNHEIIEIGCVIYNQNKDKILTEWVKKIKPNHICTASQVALNINGYSKNPKAYKGDLKTTLLKFNKIVDGCIVVGQNIDFDVKFIEAAMERFKIEPTFDRHRKLDLLSLAWPAVYDKEINGLSLKHLCSHFGISNEGAHSALIDCKRSLDVYKNLMKIYRGDK